MHGLSGSTLAAERRTTRSGYGHRVKIVARHVDDLLRHPRADTGADVAVVIDVVRAFTVAPWCLEQGASRLLLAPSLDAATQARRTRYPEALLLKDGAPDPAFALANAPGSIARTQLDGRTVIQRTGNGTRGAHAVATVPLVLCAGFVTATATARAIRAAAPEVLLLVPTEGDEDWALADYLTALLTRDPAADAAAVGPYLARAAASAAAQECRERGPDPAWPGFDPDDLDRCLETDRFDRAVRAFPDGDLLAASWFPAPTMTDAAEPTAK